VADALLGYGLEVYTASNEEMALKLAYEHRPEFILMDYLLRGSTGTDAVKAIHKHLPNTQVIMISGFEDLCSEYHEQGCNRRSQETPFDRQYWPI
jgi:YesN/AraC family two-component response regulator